MKKIIQLVLFLVISFGLCSMSITSAKADTSVADVEKLLAKGEYDKAKSELENVIEKHPDSIVAHKYMLEVLKLEYAATLEYSVEYKLYEEILKNIIKKDKEVYEAKKREQSFISILAVIGVIVVFACGLGLIILLNKLIVKRRNLKLEQEKTDARYSELLELAVKYGVILNDIFIGIKNGEITIDKNTESLFMCLSKDHDEVIECIKNRDINFVAADQHMSDLKQFLINEGLSNVEDFL